MILFFIAVTAYVGSLILVKPAPSSLKSASISYIENLKLVWASICSGVFILFIFLFITNFSFVNVDESLYRTFVLSNDGEKVMSRPLQLVSHLFVHGNLLHLATNVIGLGIASTYERRVGAKRYLSVLVVGALSSIPSVLFYSDNTTVCGISGGVFGLAAAYFTDEKELTTKEWLTAIFLFTFLVILLILEGEIRGQDDYMFDIKVDHIGHFLGALGVILYCRLIPQRCNSDHYLNART